MRLATADLPPLSLHAALPICPLQRAGIGEPGLPVGTQQRQLVGGDQGHRQTSFSGPGRNRTDTPPARSGYRSRLGYHYPTGPWLGAARARVGSPEGARGHAALPGVVGAELEQALALLGAHELLPVLAVVVGQRDLGRPG